MEEIYNRKCWDCRHEAIVDYDSNTCPNCGAESIPTIDSPVIKEWPDNSAIQLIWDGKRCMALKIKGQPRYPSGKPLEF